MLHPLLVRLLDVPARVDGSDTRRSGRPLLQAIHGLAHQAAHPAETYGGKQGWSAFGQRALQRPLSIVPQAAPC